MSTITSCSNNKGLYYIPIGLSMGSSPRGNTKIENLESNIKALSVKLTPEEMAELESTASATAAKGDRCPAAFLCTLVFFEAHKFT